MQKAIENLNKIKPNNRVNTSEPSNYNILDHFPIRGLRPDISELSKKQKKPKNQAKIDYYQKVWEITEKNAPNIENIHLRGQNFHLDHIIPISYGFKNSIDPATIGDPKNLRIISKKHNFTKNSRYPFD